MCETKAFNLLRLALILSGTSAISYDVSYHHIPEGRIIDGLEAHPGQFPFTAGLEATKEGGKMFCGGSFILAEWILTAAHCLTNAQFVHIYLGATYHKEAEIGYAIWRTDFFIHPSWDPSQRRHDIALIRIPTTNFCDNLWPIPLPTMNSPTNYVGKIAIVSGWGRKYSDMAGHSECLQWTKVQILSNEICKRIGLFVNDAEICLDVGIQGMPWRGDSGGPVFLESTGELIGVLSRTLGQVAKEKKPLMATRIVNSLPWIKTVTGIS